MLCFCFVVFDDFHLTSSYKSCNIYVFIASFVQCASQFSCDKQCIHTAISCKNYQLSIKCTYIHVLLKEETITFKTHMRDININTVKHLLALLRLSPRGGSLSKANWWASAPTSWLGTG